MEILKNTADLDQLIELSHRQPVIIFKHSATCPFSARAQEQITNLDAYIPVGGIVVQYAADLKTEIAEKLAVEHQSPQAIVVHRGAAVDSYWRDDIQQRTLEKQIRDLKNDWLGNISIFAMRMLPVVVKISR